MGSFLLVCLAISVTGWIVEWRRRVQAEFGQRSYRKLWLAADNELQDLGTPKVDVRGEPIMPEPQPTTAKEKTR